MTKTNMTTIVITHAVQHVVEAGLKGEADIATIGEVIEGTHAGRTSDDEITLFDGTGVGLQDLAVASVGARVAQEKASRHASHFSTGSPKET